MLETWVQTAFFDRILDRANTRFFRMSNGQYELKRRTAAENFRAQSGLELRNLRLVLAEDLEEQFRKAQAEARATERGNADQS